ncbi:hypothetical protein HAX54_041530 [Datura stramonium]|uniref:Cation-transporting P-type ATPase C-terminal domain-containing protein n=1 Tax=Datura stramonium TaxID=4076 RepID=A0ABS8RHR7_DATST|nr:hypothetical protein [Datura stramonium]
MQLLQRININRIVQEKKWDEFYDFGGVTGFAEALNSNLENGIVGDTEDIRIRNAMMIKFPQTCLFCLLFEALGGWTVFLLAVAIILSFAFGVDEEGIQKCWLDNLILLMSIVGLIMFKLAWIYWEDKKLMKKTKERKRKTQRETEEVRIIRGGIEGPIPNSDLVYGDIVCLRKGDLVPANGIFVSNCGEPLEVQDDDDDVEYLCINDQNPFLLLGSKVIEGDAKMIVTSLFVGNEADQWTERMRQAITKSTSHTGFDFDACFEKLRSRIHVVGLVINILTFVVLFVHFKFQQKDDGEHEYELEIEEEPAKFSQIVNFIRKFAIDIKLTTLVCLSIVGMTEGLSLVVSRAIVYWKRKRVVSFKDYSKIDTALLLKVESSVTTIVCSVKNDWLTEQNHQEVIRDIAVKTLTELGEVQTIFVSPDDVDELKNIVCEVGLVNNPNNNNSDDEALSLMVIDGEEFHQFSDTDKMEIIDRICIMGNCSLTQKLLLVKTLKLKGKVVLMLGEGKSDGLVIEKADFGMYIDTWSFDYLIGMLKLGRFISGNVKKFIQVELILTLASWSINLITVIIMGNSPFTTLELIWLNFLVTFPGGLALFTGQLEDECLSVDKSKPVIISKAMWRNIIIQVTYQVSISVALQCKGRDKIIFNGFALCQFFSILCAREPEKKNIFKDANYWFWATCGVFLFLQVAFVEAATLLSSDSLRLDWKLWAVCFLIGAATCFFDWAGKFASQYSIAAVVASASLSLLFKIHL